MEFAFLSNSQYKYVHKKAQYSHKKKNCPYVLYSIGLALSFYHIIIIIATHFDKFWLVHFVNGNTGGYTRLRHKKTKGMLKNSGT